MVNKYLYPKGGAETYFLKIGEYLTKQENEVIYFGMYDEKNIVGNRQNLYAKNKDFHKKMLAILTYPFQIIYSFDSKRKIKKIIEIEKPDIIHLNNINFQLTPSIIDIASKLKVPIVQTVHDYQMICPNHLMYNFKKSKTCQDCLKESKWNCLFNRCIHNSGIKSLIGTFEGILYKYRKNYDKVNLYICPSKFMENMLLNNILYHKKTTTIHNFIELSNIDNKSFKKDNYVLYFGRLSSEKGIELLKECIMELPQIQFKIAGTGPLNHIFDDVSNADFVVFKSGKELQELIGRAMFTLYPSIWFDNCPLSILESESLGTPVIATKMGGIPELIEQYKTGILIDIGVKSLKKAIIELYDNPDLLANMSKNCIEKRKEMIRLDDYCEKLVNIYKKVRGE